MHIFSKLHKWHIYIQLPPDWKGFGKHACNSFCFMLHSASRIGPYNNVFIARKLQQEYKKASEQS